MATEVNNSESDNESRGRSGSESNEPSHNMEGLYAVLAETNNQYRETWYYFIRYDTNVEALEQLYAQLDSIEWVYLESYSTFALDLEHLGSPQTAKELTKLCVNEGSYHRKFDGTLEFINFGFRKRDNNIVRLINVCDTIGFGNIENFIDKEDFDPEDFEEEEEDESESESESEEESSDSSVPETKSSVRPASRQSNRQNTKATRKGNSSEGNSNKQEEKKEEPTSPQSNTPTNTPTNKVLKSSLPPPPVPPPSPAITPTQQPNSSSSVNPPVRDKKKSKKKN